MNGDPDSERALLRREMDHSHIERFKHLETKLDDLEVWVRNELKEIELEATRHWSEHRQDVSNITTNIQRILDRQSRYEPAMDTIEKVIHSGMVMRWIILFVVAALAAIGTTATAWEAIKVLIRWDN